MGLGQTSQTRTLDKAADVVEVGSGFNKEGSDGAGVDV